jgi:hypothetical protein
MLLEHPNSNLLITQLHQMEVIAQIVTLNMTWQLCLLNRLTFLLKIRMMEMAARRVHVTIRLNGNQMTYPKTE